MFYENDILLRQNSGMGVRNDVIMKKKGFYSYKFNKNSSSILLEN